MDRVFICYSRKDAEFVDAFVHDLNSVGVATWYDVNDISRDKASNSQTWRRAVDRALRECTHMIVVLSPNSVASEEVEAEWNYFLKQKRPIFPILYRDCDIPYRLDALNWFDFRYDYEGAFNNLVELLPYRPSQPLTPPPIDTSYKYEPAYEEPSVPATSGWMGIPYMAWGAGGAAAIVLLTVLIIIVNSWRNGDGGEGTPTATDGVPTQATVATQDGGVPTDQPTNTVTETPTENATEAPTEVVIPTPIGGGGGKIAFVTNRDGNDEIYVMDSDGQNQSNLTNNPANDTQPVWSPDGSQIAFVSDREGNLEIYVLDIADGSVANRSNNSAPDYAPTWSPNGTQIAFISERGTTAKLFVMAVDGSNPTRLTTAGDDQAEIMPAWSPDGTQIAYVVEQEGNREVYVAPLEASEGVTPTNLTNNEAQDDMPTWSPDGTQIAFVADRGGNNEIYVMSVDGTSQTPLTNDGASDGEPSWSPDGSRIAFASERDGNSEIYVMEANGANPTRITTNEVSDNFPSWQPASIPFEPTQSPLLALIFDFAAYLLPSD